MVVQIIAASHAPHLQAWSERKCQAIRTYKGQNPKTTWSHIKRWYEAENPNKDVTESQSSKNLNPKRPHGPSDIDPAQVQNV